MSETMRDLVNAMDENPTLKIGKRCRICKDSQVRGMVNDLLAHGHSYASIERQLAAVNATRPSNSQINQDNVREHDKRHFDVQAPARALWRRQMEKRAAESDGSYQEGITNIVTAMAYADLMMRRGLHTLLDEETQVSPTEGLAAAAKLREWENEGGETEEIVRMQVQMGRILKAFREVVPAQYHQQILDVLDGKVVAPQAPALEASHDDLDEDDDDGFDDD